MLGSGRVRAAAENGLDYAGLREDLVRFLRRRLRNSDLATDLAQEAITRLLFSIKDGSVIDPTAFAFRIADNLAIDAIRSRRRRSFSELGDDIPSEGVSPAQSAEARSAVAALGRALDRLPKLRREIFLRKRLHGQSYEQIGAETGLSTNAIEKHISRAMQSLAAVQEDNQS
jgi:RNA polymerase sigma-70 factor (ECF subfamily)